MAKGPANAIIGSEAALYCLGVDHHRTPLDLRERLSVSDVAIPHTLAALRDNPCIEECVLLSTCNRSELYVWGRDCQSVLTPLFAEQVGVDTALLDKHAYVLRGREAMHHLFRVVASLESMVIGEYQIIHQVKTAYHMAQQCGCTSTQLDALFQRALTVAKDVRSHTSIGAHKVSVASVGVDLARHIHGKLDKAKLLVVGAGEIAELATVHLLAAGVSQLTLINRTHEKALDLAQHQRFREANIQTLRWSALQEGIASHDIMVTSTAATRPVITADTIRAARRRALSPLVIIDLAVPRDVEVAAGDLGDVYRYDLDHLDHIVAANRDIRREDLDQVEDLINRHLDTFLKRQALAQSTLPSEVSQWFEALVDAEFQRLSNKLPLEAQHHDILRYGLHRVAAKLRHRSLQLLREHPDDPQREQLLRDLFDL